MRKRNLYFITLALFVGEARSQYDIKNEKIIICGVGKNIAQSLPNMIKKIESLGQCFADYHVIIYENNSTDNTPILLKNWAKKNNRIDIISENLCDTDLFKRTKAHAKRDQAPCRMELIAYGRNQVLQKAMAQEFHDFNFLIMTDLDFTQGWQVKDVLNCFSIPTEWDCITANGIDYSGKYYDRYAYRDERFILGPELIGEDFWTELDHTPLRFTNETGLKKVYSAFGGIALYRKQVLLGCTYDGYVTQDFKTFISLVVNTYMSKKHPHYKLYKKIIAGPESELPIIFQANCGYDGPVVCEHSTLHATMILNGYDKIYVNPNLLCRY